MVTVTRLHAQGFCGHDETMKFGRMLSARSCSGARREIYVFKVRKPHRNRGQEEGASGSP